MKSLTVAAIAVAGLMLGAPVIAQPVGPVGLARLARQLTGSSI